MSDDCSGLPAREVYNVPRWGDGYFDIDEQGHLRVHPHRDRGPAVDLRRIIAELPTQGVSPPVLLRFPAILRDRVEALCSAFDQAMAAAGYRGAYQPVYPIKVNQQRSVVEEIVGDGQRVGLEAGSKPELMAVLALAPAGGTVICNGYKDPEYVRLALRGLQLGLQVYLVLEKPSETRLIIREARRLGIPPRLGLRIRLASIGAGKWQNTGGERSKFGLSAADALTVVEELRQANLLSCLELLHFHLGSQIANVHDIRRGLSEGARFYGELRRLGAPVAKVDVGGGLGVDYEGTRSRAFCSMNYSIAEYAQNVIGALKAVCDETKLPHPAVITESGRAMTAHHAVLVTSVIDTDSRSAARPEPPGADAHPVLRELYRTLEAHESRPATEVYHDTCHYLEEAHSLYLHGVLDLPQRAYAERCYQAIGARLRERLNPGRPHQREVLDALNERLADKLFANFSVFQSIPDVWAINQIFPIVPLSGLNRPLIRRGVVQDLTCDSDGTVSLYVDGDGVESTLPLPDPEPGEPLWLGIFMVGAYQEILGDRHNLFGATDSVNVEVTREGHRFTAAARGDSVGAILSSVGFDERELSGAYRRRVAAAELDETARRACLADLEAGLLGGTYLESP
ncbi:MAG: biosynthetic arginine decarboxylase [Halorhodospira sp.]